MKKYDCIIIGAGHNGLVCGNYLSKAGLKVLILESTDSLGGVASTRAVSYTHLTLPTNREV